MITLKITVVVTLCFSQVKAMGALSPNDPSSYSRPEFAVMKHVSLDLNVDFEKKILNGTALLNFDVLEKVGELILDVNGLTINSVETEDGKPMAYKIDGDIPNFGSRLTITLPDVPEKPSDGKKVTPRESINDPGTTVESKSDAAEPSSQSKNDDEPSSKSIEDAGPSSKPIEDAGTSSKPIENAGQSSKPIENAEPSSKPIENAEPSSKQIENAEPSSKPIENAEPSSKPIENAEPSSKPIENAGPPSKSIENAGPPSKSIENAGPPSKSIKDAGPNTESQNVVSSTPLEAAKSCPGCGPVPATLSVSYNGYFYKPLLDKTTSMKKEKEATSNEKDKKNGIEDSEPCSCPTSTIVTIENIHNPCDSGKCTCGVSTNSYPKITCQGCSDSDCTFLEMQEKPEEWELEYEDKVSRVSAGVQTDYYKIISTSKATSMVDKSTSFVLATGVSETAKTHTGAASPIHGTNDVLKIRINYATSPTASALQWLDPQQTTGKKHPYLFSQCQPIHARSILPCQDTPAVKFTYDAQVTAPEQFTVLMSALRGGVNGTKTTFRQPMPIPSYLLAIAVGVLEHKQLGPRSAVWTEKEDLERSAWEFAETEKFLQAAERLCGPYEWSQYDLLVLPPSFPYGGMENPCLTFVTPTLLAGDRSQADVIVHEIMHSWTGNLVTNKNFEHFWLNEGFTVFLERKVGASLIADKDDARKSRDFHSLLGLQELNEAINDQFRPTDPLTRLSPDLTHVHPDDAFSRVPYEKGSLFLRYLEDLVGGPEVFDDFLRAYLNRFKKKSLDTDEFKAFLLNYFKGDEKLKTVDWDSWLYKPGMPPVIPNYETSMTKDVTSLLDKINSDAPLDPADVRSFTPHQVINLLQELIDRPPLSRDRLASLGREYDVANSNNSEIKYRWLRLCIRSRDEEKVPEALDFVNQQGRMKYIRPLYRDLYAWQQVRDAAIANFLKNEKNMMHVSAYTVRKELHLNVINE